VEEDNVQSDVDPLMASESGSWAASLLKQPIVYGGAILLLLFLGGNWMLSERQAQAHVATLDLTPKNQVVWNDDLIAAEAEARRQNKPIFIDFGATWCGPCQHMQNEVFNDPKVYNMLKRFVCVHVDVDQDPTDSNAFGVQGIPRMIVQTPERETRMDLVGSREPGPFVQLLGDSVGLASSASAAN